MRLAIVLVFLPACALAGGKSRSTICVFAPEPTSHVRRVEAYFAGRAVNAAQVDRATAERVQSVQRWTAKLRLAAAQHAAAE